MTLERHPRILSAAGTLVLALPLLCHAGSPGQAVRTAYETLRLMTPGGREEGEPDKCGLPAIAHALSLNAGRPLRADSPLGILMTRPAMQANVRAGGFVVHFDTAGADAPAMLDAAHQRIPGTARQFADSVAAMMTYVARVETTLLGYTAPPPDGMLGGGPEYDVYVLALGGGTYGYTPLDDDGTPEGGRSTTFMVIDNDFDFVSPPANRGLPALRVTLAHEYFHAIQIGSYAYRPSDIYFHEISSVWMEDVAYTDVNDYYNYLRAIWGQFRNPDVPFTSNNAIMYSRGIWGQYASGKFGPVIMRNFWEETRGARPLQAMDIALHQRGSSLREGFGEWTLWNCFTGPRSDSVHYYAEGAHFPLMVRSPVEYTPPRRDVAGALQALASRYYEVVLSTDTLTLAIPNVNVAAAEAGATTSYPYTVALASDQQDAGFRATAAGIFVKLESPDPTNWICWDLVHGAVGGGGSREGEAFPNPFVNDGSSVVAIPADATDGTLAIYSSAMDLLFTAEMSSVIRMGRRVFAWDGRTNDGGVARSGVYVFVLALRHPDRVLTGKIAVVRK